MFVCCWPRYASDWDWSFFCFGIGAFQCNHNRNQPLFLQVPLFNIGHTVAQLFVIAGDHLEIGADHKISFSVQADSSFPEEPSTKVAVRVKTVPSFQLDQGPSSKPTRWQATLDI